MTAAVIDPGIPLPHFPDAVVIAPPDLQKRDLKLWLRLRREGIGGSDILTALGMNTNADKLQLFLEKRGEYTRLRTPQLDRSARRGRRLESLVAEFFAEDTGYLVVGAPGMLAHRREPWMRVNLDGMAFDPNPAITEYKTRTWRSARLENWSGTEPPDGPTVQALWGLAVTGWQRAYVAGLVDDDLHWFRVERDEELIAHIVERMRSFWFDHVIPGIPPAPGGNACTTELLSHLWDVKPGAVKVFDPDEVNDLRREKLALREQAKQLNKRVTKLQNRQKTMLGDAEEAVTFEGETLFSWRRNGNFASARFREEEPELAAKYSHLVEDIDIELIKKERPDLYERFRARVFREGNLS